MLLLACGAVVNFILGLLHLPSLLGYVALGVVAGPSVLGLLSDNELSTHLAELGIMALMFTIGLKFSLPKLLASRRNVFGLGASQVFVCIAFAVAVLATAGLRWNFALLAASIFAMSSTAVVLRMLFESGEVTSPLGTRVIAVLLFQDLAVIPLLILFSSSTAEVGPNLLYTAFKITAVLIVVLNIGPKIMPPLLDLVSKQRSSELFTLFVLVLVLGLSLLTQLSGLSLVLGAFLAGMLLAESMHRYKVEEMINPFRELFLGFFFISIGLLFRPHLVFASFPLIIAGSALVLLLKPLIIYGLARLFLTHHWNAVKTALLLGGCGEFGFVLLATAQESMPTDLLQTLFSINLLVMLVSPLLVAAGNKLRSRLGGDRDWMISARDVTRLAAKTAQQSNHVILCGYGRTGQVISRMLGNRGIPWAAVESNHELFASAFGGGENVCYGDARNPEVLIGMGITSAKFLITTYENQHAMVRTVQQARALNPSLKILAKVYKAAGLKEARAAGANFVTLSSLESALSMSALAMRTFGVGLGAVETDVHKEHTNAKESTYFYTDSRPADAAAAEDDDMRKISLTLDTSAYTVGRTVGEATALLSGLDASVFSVMRGDQSLTDMPDERLRVDDVIVVTGDMCAAESAEGILLAGR